MPAKILSEAELSKGDLWVFGYGSLMWRPGFEFVEQVPARLIGEHRALCVYSFVHRGTPEQPGLVLGLDRGGACRGIAFRVAAQQRRRRSWIFARARAGHHRLSRGDAFGLAARTKPAQRVSALAYVVDRGHVQYAGRLSLADQLRHVRQGHGRSGANRDYVHRRRCKAIEAQGFRDAQLHQLAAMLHEDATLTVPRPDASAAKSGLYSELVLRRREFGTRPNNCACSARAASTSRSVAASIAVDDLLDEFAALQAGRQRIEKFDHQRAGIAHEGAARPEQPGIERHRQAGHAAVGIDLRDAGLVVRRRVDRGCGCLPGR